LKFSPEWIQKSWSEKVFSVKNITGVPIVRDLSVINGGVVFAEGSGIKSAFCFPEKIQSSNFFQFQILHEMNGHRREVTCLAVDHAGQHAVAGGRDRHLTLWNLDKGSLVSRMNDAHSRLITCVKIYEKNIFSSSRDRSVKIWSFEKNGEIELEQILAGNHQHSVWGIDVLNNILVTSSADKSIGVWNRRSFASDDHSGKLALTNDLLFWKNSLKQE
jgi:WD40 repeat protein